MLLFKLYLFILFLEVAELLLQRMVVFLLTPQLIDFCRELIDKIVLVLGQTWHNTVDHNWLWWWRQCIPGYILRMPHLISKIPALGKRASNIYW